MKKPAIAGRLGVGHARERPGVSVEREPAGNGRLVAMLAISALAFGGIAHARTRPRV